MASANVKKLCATCKKIAGVATCDGCQRSFCSKHFSEHRQELSQQIDNIGQEHDLLRRDLDQCDRENPLLSRINKWEQESITKIQVAAEAARVDLRELLDKNKRELQKSVTKITDELQSSRELDDYTETDINKWTGQLQMLRKMLESPSAVFIKENETPESIIRLIRVRDQQQRRSSKFPVDSLPQYNCVVEKASPSSDERFDEIVGEAYISEEGLVVTCTENSVFSRPAIYGANRYWMGTNRIRFRIDKTGISHMFFGIIAASMKMKTDVLAVSLYGWWDLVRVVVNGQIRRSDHNKLVQTGDEVTLIVDCNNRQIQSQHHRTNQLRQLPIDINECPFPWKIVVRLGLMDDSVRILQ